MILIAFFFKKVRKSYFFYLKRNKYKNRMFVKSILKNNLEERCEVLFYEGL